MKTKIKRHSRAVISVILALSMLVSCVTAGIIATDAAKTQSESVGATTYYYRGTNVANASWDTGAAFTAVTNSDKYVYVTKTNTGDFQITSYQTGWNNTSGRFNQTVDTNYGCGGLTNASGYTNNIGDSNTGTHYIVFDTVNSKTFALKANPVIDTIYIRDDANWGKANIKLFTFSNSNSGTNSPANGNTLGAWKGTNMTDLDVTELDENGTTVYQVTGFLHTAGLILNNDSSQTGDMTLTSGHLYTTGTGSQDQGVYSTEYTGISVAASKTDDNSTYSSLTVSSGLTVSATTVDKGSSVNVSAPATVTSGGVTYAFSTWESSNGSFGTATNSSTTFTPSADDATATAKYKRQYSISASVNGSGGSLASNKTTVVVGDSYIITATPGSGKMLSSLTLNGSGVTATNNAYTGTASGTTSTLAFVATFADEINVSATKKGDGSGTVKINSGTASSSSASATVAAGSQVTFTAAASSNYTFCGWYRDAACTDLVTYNAEYTVAAISTATALYADFEPANFYLSGYLRGRNWTGSDTVDKGLQSSLKNKNQFAQDATNKNLFKLTIDLPGQQWPVVNTGSLNKMYLAANDNGVSGSAAATAVTFYKDVTQSNKWYVSGSDWPFSDSITFTWDAVAKTLSWTYEMADDHSYLYVEQDSSLNAYIWSDNNTQIFGAWPGTSLNNFPTITVDGKTYYVIDVSADDLGNDTSFGIKLNKGDNTGTDVTGIALGDSYILTYDSSEKQDASSLFQFDITATARKMAFNPTTGVSEDASDAASTIGTAAASASVVQKGSDVTLTATLVDSTNYTFEGWFTNEDCTGDAVSNQLSYTVTPTGSTDYYALFKEKTPASYTVTASSNNNSYGTAEVTGGNAAAGGKAYKGANVTVTATKANGYKLSHWMVNGSRVEKTGYSLTINNISADTTVQAVFVEATSAKVNVIVNDTEYGTATASVSEQTPGETVTITLAPAGDSVLESIKADDANAVSVALTKVNDTTYTFTMPDDDVTVNVNFKYYEALANWWIDGKQNASGNPKTIDSGRFTEAMYNGQKYAYYYVSDSSVKLFAVKNSATAGGSSSSGSYFYVEVTNSADWSNDVDYKFSTDSDWHAASFVRQYDSYGSSKKLWKAQVPTGATSVQFRSHSVNSTTTETISGDKFNSGAVYVSGTYGANLTTTSYTPTDSSGNAYTDVYSGSSGSGTSTEKVYAFNDDSVYQTDANAYGLNLGIEGYKHWNNSDPTWAHAKTNGDQPYYVIIFYPNTDYGTINETTANNTTSNIAVIASSSLPGGAAPAKRVTVYAKDGTIRDGYQVQSEAATTVITKITAPDGTVLYENTVASTATGETAHTGGTAAEGITFSKIKEGSGNPGSWYEKVTQIPVGSVVSVRTVLANDKDMFALGSPASGKSFRDTHYVIGYISNGVTYELHSYSADGVYTEDITIPKTTSISNFEITPVFYMKDATNCKTFIIQGYDSTVISAGWGNTLAAYPYYYNKSGTQNAFGGYPGNPFLFYGGTYMVQIPITHDGTSGGAEIRGITLSNYYWDTVHRTADSEELKDHRQTYDYDDFFRIYKEKDPDNIYLSFKYRNTQDNFNDGYGYTANVNHSDSSVSYNDYAVNGNGVEDLTDALNRRINIFGDVLTKSQLATADAGQKKVLIVSNGYTSSYLGDYATEWTIYLSTDGGSTYTKQASSIAPSVLLMNDDTSFTKYTDYDPTNAAAGRLAYYKGVYDALKNISDLDVLPAEISYEKDIRNYSKEQAWRLDARWLYSNNTDKINAKVKIEYLPLNASAYIEDPFTDPSDISSITGSTTGTKAYFTNVSPKNINKKNTATDFVIDPEDNFTMLAEEASGYEFVGWYVQYEGHDGETQVSKEGFLNGSSPIIANATFIARFKAVQSGSLNVSHVVEKDATYNGNGTPYIKYTITDTTSTVVDSSDWKESSAYNFKNSTYIKSKFNDYTITVDLKTTAASGSKCMGFVDNYTGTPFELTNVSVTNNEQTATATFKVRNVLADSRYSNLSYISHLQLLEVVKYDYDVTFTYRSRFWGNQSFNLTGEFDDDEVSAYVTGSKNTAELTTDFIRSIRPYEDNFREVINWNYNNVTQTRTSSTSGQTTTYTISATVPYDYVVNDKVNAEFVLPYKFAEGEAVETTAQNGKGYIIKASSTNSVNLQTEFFGLFSTDGEIYKVNDGTTPVSGGQSWDEIRDQIKLMTAPEKMYRIPEANDNFTFTFNHTITDYVSDARDWLVTQGVAMDDQTEEMWNAKAQELYDTAYTEAYNAAYKSYYANFYTFGTDIERERTYSLHINGEDKSVKYITKSVNITGITDISNFEELTFYRWVVKSNAKSDSPAKEVTYCYEKGFNLSGFENYTITPEYLTATAYANAVKATAAGLDTSVTYLENSRNQWNVDSGAKFKDSDSKTMVKADKMFADFNLSYSYNGEEIRNMDSSSTKVGLIIERLGKLDGLNDGDVVTDYKVYQSLYGETVDATTKSTLENFAKGTAKSISTTNGLAVRSAIDLTELDNKNRIEYYYTFNNKQVVYSDNNREFSETTDKQYVYRAFTYIVVNGEVKISEKPAYFTLYDMATR